MHLLTHHDVILRSRKRLLQCLLPVLLGVEEPLSGSVLMAGSPETVGAGEVVSSFTSISVLDWDWRMALPFEARICRDNERKRLCQTVDER